MSFFDTLKDKNLKALFQVIAPALYPTNGRPLDHYMNDLTFEERLRVFTISHNCMKALGMPNWEQPQYLNVENTCAQILARKTRPDND